MREGRLRNLDFRHEPAFDREIKSAVPVAGRLVGTGREAFRCRARAVMRRLRSAT